MKRLKSEIDYPNEIKQHLISDFVICHICVANYQKGGQQ